MQRQMWKKIQIQRSETESVSRKETQSVLQMNNLDERIRDLNESLIDDDDFFQKMQKQVQISDVNESKIAIEQEKASSKRKDSILKQNQLEKCQIKLNLISQLASQVKYQQSNELILLQSRQLNTNEKYYDLKYLINELKQQQEEVVQYVQRKLNNFKYIIQQNTNKADLMIHDFTYSSLLKEDTNTSFLKQRIKEQQNVIYTMKTAKEQRSDFIEKSNLYSKLNQATQKISSLEDQLAIIKSQNIDLQEKVFDFQQKQQQFDLEVEKKVLKRTEIKQKQKRSAIQQSIDINFRELEEEIETISKQRYQNTLRREDLDKKEQQLLSKENALNEFLLQLQCRQKQVSQTLEKIKNKETSLKILQQNLNKRVKGIENRQNQLQSQRSLKRIDYNNFGSSKKLKDQKEGFPSQRNHFNEEKRQSQISPRPFTSYKNVQRPLTGYRSRISRDFWESKSGSKRKQKFINSKVTCLSPNKNSIMQINQLSSRLQVLRNQIKKEIQAVK